MNKFQITAVLSVLSICFSTQVSAKIYLCGASGTLLYSEKPCEIPETDWSIIPVTAKSLDQKTIDQTVEMFRQASLKKDVKAIRRLLSNDFTFVSKDKSWTGKVIFNTDKSGFVALMTEHLLAMTSYEQTIENYVVKNIDGELVAETTSFEKITLDDQKINAKILERIKVKLVANKAKIHSIKQIEL